MENLQFSVRALAALMDMSIVELAEKCGINPHHLKQVSAGNVTMTGEDLKRLANFTKVPADNIKTE